MRRASVVAAGLLAMLTVAACSHGSTSSTAMGAMAVQRQAAPVPAASATGAATAGSAPAGQSASGRLLVDGTKIRVADVTVAVRGAANVAAMADKADAIVTDAGGEVDADDRTSGPHATATLRLLVPPAELLPTLSALAKLGDEKGQRLSTTDVTQQVADVNSRVDSAKDSIARLRVLFASARKVSDVIEIEGELNTRESDLESLEAQQAALTRETATATITLRLVTAAARPVGRHHKQHHRGGFVGGLQRGWHGFTHAATWLAGALGTLLPFLAVALLLALAARALWGRRRPTPAPSD
jgi:hypothetical protein